MDLNERLAAVTAEYRQLMLEAKIKKAEADLLASHLGLQSDDDAATSNESKPKRRLKLTRRMIIDAIRTIGRPCLTPEIREMLPSGIGVLSPTLNSAKKGGFVIGRRTTKIARGGHFLMEWSLPEWMAKDTAVPAQQSETFAA